MPALQGVGFHVVHVGIQVAKCRTITGSNTAVKGPRNMSRKTSVPASNLFASRWWARLVTITAEHSERPQQRKRHWTRTLRELIRARR